MSGSVTLFDSLSSEIDNSEPVGNNLADSFSTGSSPVLFDSLSLGVYSFNQTAGDSLTVTLTRDAATSPGAPIETLGVIPDNGLPQTANGVLTLNSFAPVLLAANTRYWIKLTDTAGSDDSWTITYSSNGTGVATEYYQTTGTVFPNADGPYRMQVQGEVACFGRGTLIQTPTGEKPVERLRVGDEVVTIDGGARPIVWVGIGRTRITAENRERATPVIVRRDALAEGVPHRDLVLTRGHSLLIDGRLVPVELLVNGRSILWDRTAETIEYYHLEVAGHAVLIADGAPAESYRDDGNRSLFLLAADATRPAAGPVPACAPILNDGPDADRLWQRFSDRAGQPAGITADPDLHLLADGARIMLEAREGGRYAARLASRPDILLLCSRAAIPAEIGHCRDGRRLGVAVSELVLRQAGVTVHIAWDAPLLGVGFHQPEPGFRWTDGAAPLPLALLAGLEGEMVVEIAVAMTAPYLIDGPAAAGSTGTGRQVTGR